MMIRSTDIAHAVACWQNAMINLEQPLNAADARLGDGDTGGMLARLIHAMAAVPIVDDVGQQFIDYGKAAMMATGSSLGNLCAAALMAIGRATKGQDHILPSRIGDLLGVARDTMLERGQAALGDKTVVDLLDALAQALSGKEDPRGMVTAAVAMVDETLDRFRARPIRTGRARMFGDRTIGIDDPGMLAFALLTKAFAHQR